MVKKELPKVFLFGTIVAALLIFLINFFEFFAFAFGGGFNREPLALVMYEIYFLSLAGIIVGSILSLTKIKSLGRKLILWSSWLILLEVVVLFIPNLIKEGILAEWIVSFFPLLSFIIFPTAILCYLLRKRWIILAAVVGVLLFAIYIEEPPYQHDMFPTKGRIAFVSWREESHLADVYISEGSKVRKLTNTQSGAPKSPSLSPDGEWVAYAAQSPEQFFDEIYVIKTDDSSIVKNLTNNKVGDESPSWSPDGKQIAFSSNHDGIYLINPDGSDQRILTECGEYTYGTTWSPDGKWIAFSSGKLQEDGYCPGDIYRVDIDGKNKENLTNSGARDQSPSWSPDGKWIAFQSNKDGNFEIYLMDIDGLNVQRLTNNKASDMAPSWSPDGKWIVFESTRDAKKSEIYIMKPNGTNVQRLTYNKISDNSPVWSR